MYQNRSQDKVHVMIDIETLDVAPTAVILSIGACTIEEGPENTFYGEYDPDTQYERTRSQSTIDWWDKQSIPMPRSDIHLKDGLLKLRGWFSSLRAEPIVWCKGTDFDTIILTHAYKQHNLSVPWHYSSVRDFRTLKKLFPSYSYPKNPRPHHALADAKHQAEELKGIMRANPNLTLA